MKPYHPANLKLQPYGAFRVVLLAWAAKVLGVQFHLNGIPFGSDQYHRPKDEYGDTMSARSIS